MNQEIVIQTTKQWINKVVIGLELCPFAKQVFDDNSIRYFVSKASSELDLLADIEAEITWLLKHPQIRTSFIIHPQALTEFDQYNQFLYQAEQLLFIMGLEQEFQIASFHPDYQFVNTSTESPENFTNRSPFPMLHLLRESDVTQAVEFYPDIEAVPHRNIEKMQNLGYKQLTQLIKTIIDNKHG